MHPKTTAPMDYSTMKELVARKLREEILSGALVPGQELNTKELAARYRCSATPIREALSALDGEGLVSVNRHKTIKVVKLDIKEIEEIFEMRVLLEGYASNLVVSNINERILKKLQANLEEQEIYNGGKNYTKWFKLNHEFHNEIYECTRQSVLIEIINMLRDRTFHYVKAYIVLLDRRKIATSEHKEIFSAFLKGDRTQVRELSKKHLANLAKCLIDYLKAKRDSIIK